MDDRRRLWFAVDLRVFRDPFSIALLDEYGRDGICTWIAYLAACKRNSVEGQFEYGSEPEGWMTLDLDYPRPPKFSLDGFFAFSGRKKKTRRERVGRLNVIVCRRWNEWQQTRRTRAKEATGVLPQSPLREVTSAPNGLGATATILSQLGDVNEERLARLVQGFPGVNYQAEAAKLVDWCAEKNVTTKDVHARFRNWLGKATPTSSEASPYDQGDPSVPLDSPVAR